MRYKKIMILAILLVSLLAVSAVSAAENVTDDITSIDNDDENQTIEQSEILGAKDSGTFTALQKKIDDAQEGSTITLDNDYLQDGNIVKLSIDKTLTIDGNGHTITGKRWSTNTYSCAFNVYADNVVIKNVKFTNCFSQNAGAVYWKGDYGTLTNCIFSNNAADYNGGAVYWVGNNGIMDDCKFIDNNFAQHRYGGAVYWKGNDGIMNNSYFADNNVGNDLGLVYWEGDGGKLLNSQFNDENQELIWHGENGLLENTDFNKTRILWNLYANNGILNNCNLMNIVGPDSLNIVFRWNGKNGLIKNSNFINNNAVDSSLVVIGGEYCSIDNCKFINNSADRSVVVVSSSSHINIANSIFTNNHAGLGIIDFDYIFNILDNCKFIDNSIDDDAGVIYLSTVIASHYTKNIKGIISRCIFDNDSPYYYGGFSFSDNTLKIKAEGSGYLSEYTGNITVKIKDKTFKTVLKSGEAQVKISGIPAGTYDAEIAYSGCDEYYPSQITIPVTIESSTVLDVPDVTKDYGGPEKLEITLTDSGSPIANANVNINIKDRTYTKTTDSKGKAYLGLDLKAGDYDATVTYKDISTTAKVIINKLTTKNTLSYTKNSRNSFTLTASVNPTSATGNVVFNVNGKDYTAGVNGGKATYTLNNLAVGSYDVKSNYNGDANHKGSASNSIKFTVDKLGTELTAPNVVATYNSGRNLVATLKDADGKAISGAKVTIKLGTETKTLTTNSNGQVSITTNGLDYNTYTATITFAGDDTYSASSTTAKVTITKEKQQAKIYLRNALYFVLQTKMVQLTLWDANNNPIAGKTVYIKLDEYTWKYSGVTDENGNAYIKVGVGFGVHGATVSFEGDDQYNPDSKTGRVRVIKETPSLMLPGAYTKFKASNPVKIIKVYLKDRYNKPLLLGTKVFVKVNGQNYVGSIDLNGIATINIDIKNKGSYDVELYYTGNTAYNAVRKTTKITIV